MLPTLRYEKQLWPQHRFIAGVDEVGRGAFAGPLVVAAVIFPPHCRQLDGVKDSKLLSPQKRETLAPLIKAQALSFSIGQTKVSLINQLGITSATFKAMRAALAQLPQVDFALIDAFYIPYLRKLTRHRQQAIPKGDSHCYSIAAASILAKTYRDNLMRRLHQQNPQYHWHQNKGYGTLTHRLALKQFGPTRHHRKSFIAQTLAS
jgi:ribonuclease HII